MKKNAVIIIISSILVIGIIVGIVLVSNKIKENNKIKKEKENNIVENYFKFKEKVEDFNMQRKIYTNQVDSDLFVESVYKYEDWIKELDAFTEKIEAVESVSGYLKENCVNKLYDNQDVKNKCDAFIIAYETAFNYYVKDVMHFNESMEEFSSKSKTYDKYELNYEYVDINKDGKFFGKD